LYFVMGDFSPVDVLGGADETAGVAAFGGGGAFKVPEIAAWWVAAVPLGVSGGVAAGCTAEGGTFAGGPVEAGEGAAGVRAFWVVVLGARRQRPNIPSMHFPANY
jgi:hypothetical protein